MSQFIFNYFEELNEIFNDGRQQLLYALEGDCCFKISSHLLQLHSQTTSAKSKVNMLNYMTPSLYKRLSSLIDMSFYKTSESFDIAYEPEENRSSMDAEPDTYALIELRVEAEPEIRRAKIYNDNWIVEYKLKPETERVVWRSKLYTKEKVASKNHSLVERTENQVDIALNKFCNWFDTVFEDEHSHITVDYIKKLFSSGFEIHPAAHSIYIEPKQVFSIPHEVAEKYNVPELSTKNQKKKLMNLDEIIPSPIQTTQSVNVAFGRCLPATLKQPPAQFDDCMKPNFPDELRTDEYLFKGIEDLRSTKTLVKHVNKSNIIEMKPLYLKNFNYEDDEKYIPLYKKLGNIM